MERRKLCASTTFEILPLSTCTVYTVPAKILYLQWYSTDFRNLRLSPKMLRVGIWVESFKCAGILPLQCKVKTLRIDNIWNFAIFNLYTVQEKILYLQKVQTIFKIFASARRCWWCAFGWKVLGAQVVYFCNGKAKTLHIDNIWNFADFNLYTVPAKILYLQKYSTDFRNLCRSSKMLRVDIWVESFRCARILLLAMVMWKLWASTTFEILPLSTCSLCPQKCLYLQWYSTDFRNLSPRLEVV